MLTDIKSSQQFKDKLMKLANHPQFACFNIRVFDLKKDPESINGEFIGWWHGYIDFGETIDDEFHIEMHQVKQPGGFSCLDYVAVWSPDFHHGYLRDKPGSTYWRAEGEEIIATFNNRDMCEEGEKPVKTYRLEITALGVIKP